MGVEIGRQDEGLLAGRENLAECEKGDLEPVTVQTRGSSCRNREIRSERREDLEIALGDHEKYRLW